MCHPQTEAERTEYDASIICSLEPNLLRGDDLVSRLGLQHSVLMDSALVSKCISAHNSL
jgi:hypothetical protein